MKSVFIVMYLHGLIGGVIGPLPYDIQTCQEQVYLKVATAKKPSESVGLQIKCEEHDKAPKLQLK